MTLPDLAAIIDQYRAGLEAEIVLLTRLEGVADRQKEASDAHDLAALNVEADHRDGLMAGLVNIEQELRELRRTLSEAREQARQLPGYPQAVALHRDALALVSRILERDAESLDALAVAELARRETARAVEQGETTLAAYRRVMAAPLAARLIDRRG